MSALALVSLQRYEGVVNLTPSQALHDLFMQYDSNLNDIPLDRVKTLLAQGADPNVKVKGQSILLLACEEEHTALVEILVKAPHIDLCAGHGSRTPLHCAVAGGVEIFTLLLKAAREAGTAQKMVNYRDKVRKTPLIALLETRAVPDDVCNRIALLLDAGAEIDATAAVQGSSALHYAVRNYADSPQVAKLLVERGANIYLPDIQGYSPLDLATGNVSLLIAMQKTLFHPSEGPQLQEHSEVAIPENGASHETNRGIWALALGMLLLIAIILLIALL